MPATSRSRFELHGEFGGFVRTKQGKRRLVLRTASEAIRLKVPRELRSGMDDTLRLGAAISVTGVEEYDDFTGQTKRTVSHWRRHGEQMAVTRPEPKVIRICTAKSCWKAGGKELWTTLAGAIERDGREGEIELKAVGCLGKCGKGPNLKCAGRIATRCTPASAEALIAR